LRVGTGERISWLGAAVDGERFLKEGIWRFYCKDEKVEHKRVKF
jgi:hypothetical protein